MPHFIVEYTANLEADGDLPGLLRNVAEVVSVHATKPVTQLRRLTHHL